MSDYSERLRSKMTNNDGEEEPRDKNMPPSPYRVIGQISTSQPSQELERDQITEGGNGPQFFAAFTATLGNLVMGTCIGWSSPSGPLLKKSPADGGFDLTDEENSWVGCLMPAGALIGGQVGGLLMNKFGRKGGMIAGATLFAVSYLLLVVAPNVWVIYAGRFATGVCTGICSVICPVYVAEIATPDKRGFLGSCVQLMVTFGIMLVVGVGVFDSWRWISISCLIMIAVWMLCLVFVPETPAHYLAQKNYHEAREALEWLRGTIHVDQEFEEIQQSLATSANLSAGIMDLFNSQNLPPFIVSLMLMFGQQFSGMNAVMFYAVSIFESSGSKLDSNVENIIVSVVQIVATIIAALIMDRAGRRPLLNISSSIMVISIGVLGVFFYILDTNKELAQKISVLPVVSLSLFVFAFSVGFGPIPWLMMSELFSPEVKSIASSISTTFNWTLAFLVTKFYSTLVKAITEAGTFWFFAGFNVLTFFFCLLFVPETKGKTLDQIQQMFKSDRPYFFNIWVWKLCRGCTKEEREDNRALVQEEVY